MVFQSRAAPAAQPSAEFNIDGEILQDEVIEDEIIQDEVLQDELVDNPAVPEKSEDFMEAELRKEIQQQEQRRQAMKDRIQYLWGLVRAKYKPKMTDNSFYAVYKQVMEARRRAYNEFAALGIPAPGEKKVVEEEEEEEVDEPKRRKRRVRGAVRISLVMRQGMRPFIRPTPIIEPDKWTETVRDITGEELAFLLMSWIQNVGLSLYKLADKICVVDKSHQDLIHELALLITTALMTRDHNDCIWPKYKDWRMELRPEGVCVSPHLYWHALRDYKTEMMDDIKDAELHRLLYCRKPMQRQMLFWNMKRHWVKTLSTMETSGEPHPSNFAKYKSITHLFELEDADRFWTYEDKEKEREQQEMEARGIVMESSDMEDCDTPKSLYEHTTFAKLKTQLDRLDAQDFSQPGSPVGRFYSDPFSGTLHVKQMNASRDIFHMAQGDRFSFVNDSSNLSTQRSYERAASKSPQKGGRPDLDGHSISGMHGESYWQEKPHSSRGKLDVNVTHSGNFSMGIDVKDKGNSRLRFSSSTGEEASGTMLPQIRGKMQYGNQQGKSMIENIAKVSRRPRDIHGRMSHSEHRIPSQMMKNTMVTKSLDQGIIANSYELHLTPKIPTRFNPMGGHQTQGAYVKYVNQTPALPPIPTSLAKVNISGKAIS